jgi:hypothetical protein
MSNIAISDIEYVMHKIKKLSGRSIGHNVLKELLVLAGGDTELVIDASINTPGLDQCKACIIDRRFGKLEQQQ